MKVKTPALKMGKYELRVDPTTVDPTLTHFIFVCDCGYWGKGATLSEAIAASDKERGYTTRSSNVQIWMCTPESRINEEGSLVCKMGQKPAVRIN
jgi:hypothetical protein